MGYPDPDVLLHMTAVRIRRTLRAFAAGMDRQAWRLGGYIAMAVMDPKSYPNAPLEKHPKAMTESEMKAALTAIAKQRRAVG